MKLSYHEENLTDSQSLGQSAPANGSLNFKDSLSKSLNANLTEQQTKEISKVHIMQWTCVTGWGLGCMSAVCDSNPGNTIRDCPDGNGECGAFGGVRDNMRKVTPTITNSIFSFGSDELTIWQEASLFELSSCL